jgi:uncharacterized membrane protein YGL010W
MSFLDLLEAAAGRFPAQPWAVPCYVLRRFLCTGLSLSCLLDAAAGGAICPPAATAGGWFYYRPRHHSPAYSAAQLGAPHDPSTEHGMKPIAQWLDEYSLSHLNPVNKTLHWICIPPIVLSVIGLLRALPLGSGMLNAASVGVLLMFGYYLLLSWRLALGAAAVLALIYGLADLSYLSLGRWHLPAMAAVFVLAWIGQFVGHQIEGARPSFFKDLQFLLIGPLWLLAFVYRRAGLSLQAPRQVRA